MARRFNVSGPCNPVDHYMIPPLPRLPMVRQLIDDKACFVLHAPRQTGKTTSLLSLAQALTSEGRHAAAVLTMEVGDPFPDDPDTAELAILSSWRIQAERWLPAELQPPPWPQVQTGSHIQAALSAWTRQCPRPLVLFLDEIDALQDAALRSVLRQLRAGFALRPHAFPVALGLCGMRDVRDYKVNSGGSERLRTASPFNIKDESLTVTSFTAAEVGELYRQHSHDTGQIFTDEAVALAYELTRGQPWLVNALARQAVTVLVPQRATAITAAHIEQAKELLVLRRDTHLDSLADKLHEPRVRRIIEPILVGGTMPMEVMNDDLLYVRDLGLIVDRPAAQIANPIYAEVIPRTLTYVMQSSVNQESGWYKMAGGGLDMVLLLAAFQEFFAQHSEAWLDRYDYKEAGPHLILMAFLQRVVNGGGRIHREFAVGSGRADLVVEVGGRRSVIELKVRSGRTTEVEGVAQLSRYLERLGEPEGFLIIFDRRLGPSWAERLFIHEAAGPGGQRIYVFGA